MGIFDLMRKIQDVNDEGASQIETESINLWTSVIANIRKDEYLNKWDLWEIPRKAPENVQVTQNIEPVGEQVQNDVPEANSVIADTQSEVQT